MSIATINLLKDFIIDYINNGSESDGLKISKSEAQLLLDYLNDNHSIPSEIDKFIAKELAITSKNREDSNYIKSKMKSDTAFKNTQELDEIADYHEQIAKYLIDYKILLLKETK